jgi:hypothetical protein
VHPIQQRLSRAFDRIGDGRLAILIAAGTILLGIAYAATAGIASDGYGYVSETDLWIRGNPFIPEPLLGAAPWPRPEWTFAPLGYRPVLLDGAWAFVPVYSAGLPMVMALAKIIGGHEVMFWVVPAFGGLLTWMTFGIGRRLGSSRAGVIASWLVATSPPVLLMLMQPMSDVPVAAAWTTAIFFAVGGSRRDIALSGLAAALAVLIRPNTVALAGVLGIWWLVRGDLADGSRTWRQRLTDAALFAVCALPGIVITAAIYQRLFGSPFTSGYGDLSGFFGWHHVLPNIRLYMTWYCESQSRLTLLGVAALCLPIRVFWPWVSNRRALWMVLACLSLIVTQYLAYLEFDNWSFLRFLLTCWPFVMLGVAALAMLVAGARRPIATLLVSATIPGARRSGPAARADEPCVPDLGQPSPRRGYRACAGARDATIRRVLHVEFQRHPPALRRTNDVTNGRPRCRLARPKCGMAAVARLAGVSGARSLGGRVVQAAIREPGHRTHARHEADAGLRDRQPVLPLRPDRHRAGDATSRRSRRHARAQIRAARSRSLRSSTGRR